MYNWQCAYVYVYTYMYIHIVRTLQACISGNVYMYTFPGTGGSRESPVPDCVSEQL